MPRPSALCLGGLVVLVACGKLKPPSLPTDGSADSPSGAPTDSAAPSLDAGGSESITDAGSRDATSDELTVADATIDGLNDLEAADGGRRPYRAIAVATGEYHACALLDDHRVKCWGENSNGQLGLGDANNRGLDSSTMGDNLPTVDLGTGRTATAIAASRYASCAVLDDHTVKCWGNNIGNAPGEMGDHLAALDFGGRNAVTVAMGEDTACASMNDGTLWCWGGGCGADVASETPCMQGGLPMKPVRALGPADNGVVALYEDGTLSPVLPFGGPLPVVPPGRKVVAVAGGHTSGGLLNANACVLLDDATTICLDGIAGGDIGPANAIAIGVRRLDGLCSAFSNGSVKCEDPCLWPYECSSDGSFLLGSPAVMVTSNGSYFACALLGDGGIKCWQPTLVEDQIGAQFDCTQADGSPVTCGPWHPVDLGTHP